MTREPNEMQQAVSRTLRDSLGKLQRTADELNHAVADLVSACASTRPANALSPILRAQTSAASLESALEVLARFVTSSLQLAAPAAIAEAPSVAPPAVAEEESAGAESSAAPPNELSQPAVGLHIVEAPAGVAATPTIGAPVFVPEVPEEVPTEASERVAQESAPAAFEHVPAPPQFDEPLETVAPVAASDVVEGSISPDNSNVPAGIPDYRDIAASNGTQGHSLDYHQAASQDTASQQFQEKFDQEFRAFEPQAPPLETVSIDPVVAAPLSAEPLPPAAPGFDLSALPLEEQELHRRANRVAKVSMQDIKMLRPNDVKLGKEQRDLCWRLRDDLEKAHREYDRRFQTIMVHPVDYFYDWLVQILADGDPQALGEYPYPSPVLRH